MATAAIDSRIKFQLLFWYGVIGVSMLILGAFLAADQFMIAFMVAGVAWLTLLPYHAQLSFLIGMTTFSSALIVPFLPGRPYFWEFAAVLAWSGVPILILLRRFPPGFRQRLHELRWLYTGAVIYSIVLIVTMGLRGVGLRVLGSEQMGGRFYIQQLLCGIFPLLFAMIQTDEKTFMRLFLLQCVLSLTYLISDLAFSVAPGKLLYLLNFFELPNDALNFEVQSLRLGMRRFQSLAVVCQGLMLALLVFNNLRDFFGRRALILLPTGIGLLGFGFLSGHRWLVVILGIALLFAAYAQRFLTPRNIMLAGTFLVIQLLVIYAYIDRFPTAFQRTVSFLPGLQIDTQAELDAASTLWVRNTLFRVGLNLIPDYLWLGRGFARYIDDYSSVWDQTTITFHINQGKFYNGIIGLLINTGVFGTVGMLIFMLAGCRIAWRIIVHVRTYGSRDNFVRAASLIASLWMANVIGFIFLHGDSEWAMKTFSLQIGMLVVCSYLLRKRVEDQARARIEEAATAST